MNMEKIISFSLYEAKKKEAEINAAKSAKATIEAKK